jgi:hypothetical protein
VCGIFHINPPPLYELARRFSLRNTSKKGQFQCLQLVAAYFWQPMPERLVLRILLRNVNINPIQDFYSEFSSEMLLEHFNRSPTQKFL